MKVQGNLPKVHCGSDTEMQPADIKDHPVSGPGTWQPGHARGKSATRSKHGSHAEWAEAAEIISYKEGLSGFQAGSPCEGPGRFSRQAEHQAPAAPIFHIHPGVLRPRQVGWGQLVELPGGSVACVVWSQDYVTGVWKGTDHWMKRPVSHFGSRSLTMLKESRTLESR